MKRQNTLINIALDKKQHQSTTREHEHPTLVKHHQKRAFKHKGFSKYKNTKKALSIHLCIIICKYIYTYNKKKIKKTKDDNKNILCL